MLAILINSDSFIAGRVLLAIFTAFLLVLLSGSSFIRLLKSKLSNGQPIRECGPQSHLETKKGTPTMGGVLILGAIILSTLLYADLRNMFVWMCLLVLLVFGLTGFADDYVKVKKKTPDAMTAKMKLFLQFVTALIVVYFVSMATPEDIRYSLQLPYLNLAINLCWFYIPFAMIVIAGTSNAVNLSDGLDGLAAGLSVISFIAFAILAYVAGTPVSVFLGHTFIPGAQEVAVICGATIGACLGFLMFNCSPAQIFMGDTGSLALGALLGTVAVMIKQEILLAIIGVIFVIEALSVMIQVFWYKRTKTRVFLMAPIHHHFEQKGWKEQTVVIRFWVIAFLASLLGLSNLIF